MRIFQPLFRHLKDVQWLLRQKRARLLAGSKTKLRVNWFIPVNHRDYNRTPASVWIRCLQLIPYLEALGVRCSINKVNNDADVSVFVRWQDEDAYQLAQRQRQKGQRWN